MHEYPSFIYLDPQKTGSTFVIQFLRAFSTQPATRFKKHKWVKTHNPDKFCFITCRDPLDQYLSLYSFGCSEKKRGQHRKRLGEKGFGDLYDGTAAGFSGWLNFTLDARNADMFKEDDGAASNIGNYARSGIAEFAGFQTFRTIGISVISAMELFAACKSKEDLREAFQKNRIWHKMLRTERLAEDLAELVQGPLAGSMTDPQAALDYLKSKGKVNASRRVDEKPGFTISEDDKRLVEAREWLFFEELGYPRYTAST